MAGQLIVFGFAKGEEKISSMIGGNVKIRECENKKGSGGGSNSLKMMETPSNRMSRVVRTPREQVLQMKVSHMCSCT